MSPRKRLNALECGSKEPLNSLSKVPLNAESGSKVPLNTPSVSSENWDICTLARFHGEFDK